MPRLLLYSQTGQEMPSKNINAGIPISAKDKEVTLIGGEPTIHKGCSQMIEFNNSLGLGTLIYSNGHNLKILEVRSVKYKHPNRW